jgi:hypothetical protein
MNCTRYSYVVIKIIKGRIMIERIEDFKQKIKECKFKANKDALVFEMLGVAAEGILVWDWDLDLHKLYTEYVKVLNVDMEYLEKMLHDLTTRDGIDAARLMYRAEGYVTALNFRHGTTFKLGFTDGGTCFMYSSPHTQG